MKKIAFGMVVISLMSMWVQMARAIDIAATPNQLSPSIQTIIRNNLNAQVNLGATESLPGVFSWEPASGSPSNSIDSFWFDSLGSLNLSGGLNIGGKAVAQQFCLGTSCVSTWPVGGGQYFPAGTGLMSVSSGNSYGAVYNASNPIPTSYVVPGANVDSNGNLLLSNPVYAPNLTSVPATTGLTLTNLTTSNTGIQSEFTSVSLMDSTGTKTQTVGTISGTPIALSADGNTHGPAGLDTGSLIANTGYFAWVIGNGSQMSLLISTASLWANVGKTYIAGYNFSRLIGYALTDGNAHFVGFHQFGNKYLLNVPLALTLPSPTPLINVGALTIGQAGVSGTTTYSYQVVAVGLNGGWTTGTTTTSASGNAILDSTNYNSIFWTAVTGAVSYIVYRTSSVGADGSGNALRAGIIGMGIVGTAFSDTGIAADGSDLPTSNTAASLVEYNPGLVPPIATEGIYDVNNLQATTAEGTLALSLDGTNVYLTLEISSGDPATTRQFSAPFITPGAIWITYNNLPAAALNLLGFELNL